MINPCGMRTILSVLIFVCLHSPAKAAVTPLTTTVATVRVSVSPGQFQNKRITVTCTATYYTGTDGKAGCAGEKYDYAKVSTAPAWPQTYLGTVYAAADNKRFWDWLYSGYSGGGACDWTQNCHGYAFGVGDWPETSSKIIKSGATECWVGYASNATIADNGGHTVKITMKNCQNSLGLIVETSSEKFRESGTYTQTGNCNLQNGGGVDLGKGASDPTVNAARGGMTFQLYKKR